MSRKPLQPALDARTVVKPTVKSVGTDLISRVVRNVIHYEKNRTVGIANNLNIGPVNQATTVIKAVTGIITTTDIDISLEIDVMVIEVNPMTDATVIAIDHATAIEGAPTTGVTDIEVDHTIGAMIIETNQAIDVTAIEVDHTINHTTPIHMISADTTIETAIGHVRGTDAHTTESTTVITRQLHPEIHLAVNSDH